MSICVACQKPLIIQIEEEEEEEDAQIEGSMTIEASGSFTTVPDVVDLSCGCHFHWQCLLDAYTVTECPKCCSSLLSISSTGEQQVLCTLSNEGGVQENLDILPLLTEEGYLNAFPNERKCRAFLEFCREGDFEAIVDLLQDDVDDNSGDSSQSIDVLRYQDPIGAMHSGLHIAILAQEVNVAWLLLLLASRLPLEQFPAEVRQTAEHMGIKRGNQDSKTDIRSLTDNEGRAPTHLASSIGGVWLEWVRSGRLTA
ncbi:MAG: hypothetical protein M1835_000519 [Candelina submexicana]|nr:MAG: hypothetical protein M1835_000519 [Candelina submexicana]